MVKPRLLRWLCTAGAACSSDPDTLTQALISKLSRSAGNLWISASLLPPSLPPPRSLHRLLFRLLCKAGFLTQINVVGSFVTGLVLIRKCFGCQRAQCKMDGLTESYSLWSSQQLKLQLSSCVRGIHYLRTRRPSSAALGRHSQVACTALGDPVCLP